jgi:thiamine-phosphate pyrophosphorylase
MNSSALRILDANLNRAREAMRVMEDFARFALNDDALSMSLKQLRHELAEATGEIAASAVLHRNSPGDVGVANKTTSELSREDLQAVVIAAGKRLTEALRTAEECMKALAPAGASAVERLRYRAYDIEQRLVRTLRPIRQRFGAVRLYVLVSEALCRGCWWSVTEAAIDGGADCIQLREKDLESGELLGRARRLVQLCRARGVVSIINDRPDIAMLADADGVHVGQSDLPALDVRKLIGDKKLLGVSTHDRAQARQALLDGADYVGVGPVFPSKTKPRDILPGLAFAHTAASAVPIPCVAISGITIENARDVAATGVSAIAVSSAVICAEDPRAAAAALKSAFCRTSPTSGN